MRKPNLQDKFNNNNHFASSQNEEIILFYQNLKIITCLFRVDMLLFMLL